MISALVIVALIMTTTSGNSVMEFSEEALRIVCYVCQPIKIRALLLRPGTKITLQRAGAEDRLSQGSAITFVPKLSPDATEQETLDKTALRNNYQFAATQHTPGKSYKLNCGQLHGISIAGGNPSCNISEVNMIAGTKQVSGVTWNTFRFSILFQDKVTQPLRLDIPVLQLPSAVVSLDQLQLNAWASAKRVGLHTQFNKSTLRDISFGRDISFDLWWLSYLLQLGGVYQVVDFEITFPPRIPTYVTRPLVLPGDLISKYFHVIDYSGEDMIVDDDDDAIENMLVDDLENMRMRIDDTDNVLVDNS